MHLQRRQDRAARIVVVGERLAECGHDRVTEELVDFAAVVGDAFVKDLEAAIDGADELLRRKELGEPSKAADVGEQNGDRAQVAFDRARVSRVPHDADWMSCQICGRQHRSLVIDRAIPTEVVPAEVVPADVVPTDVVPTDVVPTDVVPADVVPADVVPTGVIPEDLVPASVFPTQVVTIPRSLIPLAELFPLPLPVCLALPISSTGSATRP